MTSRSKFDEQALTRQHRLMPKTIKKKKIGWGGKRAGAGAPEGNTNATGAPEGNQNAAKKEGKKQTKTVSPRLELPVYDALEARAKKNGHSPTKEAEEIIKAALT